MSLQNASFFVLLLPALLISCTKKEASTDKKDSLAAIEELLKKAPSYENHITWGLELAAKGRHADAAEAYKKAVTINPKAPLAYNNLCSTYTTLVKYVEAISNCEKAIELEPKFQLAQNNLKYAQTKLAEHKTFLAKNKAAMLGKSGITSLELLDVGLKFYDAGDHNSAIEAWSRIQPADASYAAAQNNMASSYILTKQFAKAEKAISAALKIDPKNTLFQNNKKWLEQAKSEAK